MGIITLIPRSKLIQNLKSYLSDRFTWLHWCFETDFWSRGFLSQILKQEIMGTDVIVFALEMVVNQSQFERSTLKFILKRWCKFDRTIYRFITEFEETFDMNWFTKLTFIQMWIAW